MIYFGPFCRFWGFSRLTLLGATSPDSMFTKGPVSKWKVHDLCLYLSQLTVVQAVLTLFLSQISWVISVGYLLAVVNFSSLKVKRGFRIQRSVYTLSLFTAKYRSWTNCFAVFSLYSPRQTLWVVCFSPTLAWQTGLWSSVKLLHPCQS